MDGAAHRSSERIAAALERLSRVAPDSDRRMVVFPSHGREVPERDAEHHAIRGVEDDGILLVYRPRG